MRRTLPFAFFGLLIACGESTVGSGPAELCATIQGAEVCAGRAEYRPTESVSTSVRNTTSETFYVDTCATQPVGKTSSSAAFREDYSPAFACGSDVDIDEIVANLVEVVPGATAQISVPISPFAFQGFYRINVWLTDDSGMRTSETPAFSGTFEVFPSAGS